MHTSSLEEAIKFTLSEYYNDLTNPRLSLLVELLLWHIDRMDQDATAVQAFSESNGAREYILSQGKDALLKEIIAATGTEDKEEAIHQYAIQCCSHKVGKRR